MKLPLFRDGMQAGQWLLLVGFALFSGASLSQGQAATTSIVGFYTLPVPAGNSLWVPGLVGPDVYQAAAASVASDTDGKALVQFTSPGWTGGEFTSHYAEPQSGSSAGLAIDIVSNTTDTIKLNTTAAASGLTPGMVFILRKHATLAGMLPDGGGFLPFNDTIGIFGSTGLQFTYLWNSASSKWINGLGVDSSNVIVRPGQGVVIQAKNALSVTLGKGEVAFVKTTPTQITAYPGVPNMIGPVTPLEGTTTIGSLGLLASLAAFNDSIVVLTPGSLAQFGTFLSNGSGFINQAGQTSTNVTVTTGAGVVVNVNAVKNITLTPVSPAP